MQIPICWCLLWLFDDHKKDFLQGTNGYSCTTIRRNRLYYLQVAGNDHQLYSRGMLSSIFLPCVWGVWLILSSKQCITGSYPQYAIPARSNFPGHTSADNNLIPWWTALNEGSRF
jgi:hypothetical protein